MQELVKDRFKISPYLVFYMVISMQIGIGILGYQRIVMSHAGQDSWISVLFAGLFFHIVIWMIYRINETVKGDIVSVHEFLLGKFMGKIISSIFIVYFIVFSLTVLRSYIEIIQVWIFPDMNIFWFSFAFMLLCIYITFGGFRTVVGIAFFGTVLPAYLFLTFGFNLKYAQVFHLFPIFDHSIKDILLGSYQMSLTFIGFETLLFFYPFIKEPQKSKKWAHLALVTTTLIYTGLMLITITYFSEEQGAKSIWATLTMWKILQMPFVERFEYIGIATWNLVILPNVCISIWIASRLIRRVFHFQQKNSVIFIAICILIVINFFNTREKVSFLNDFTGKMGFIFAFIYIPILFICIIIAKKVKKIEQ